MYISAQRVISPSSQRTGVNVFKYSHGAATWQSVPAAFLPDVNAGELIWQKIEVDPPGNRVLSYLDVVAPDAIPWEAVCGRLAMLKRYVHEAGNPTIAAWDPLWIRFGLGHPGIPWSTELGALAGHLVLRLPSG